MFIGEPNLFIGAEDWYIGSGSIYATATATSTSGVAEDLWIFRGIDGKVIRELDFGYAEPGTTVSTTVSAEYRGYETIRVHGFYLTEVPEIRYRGIKSPSIDKAELIRWADWFTGDTYYVGAPGLEILQENESTGLPDISQARTGLGDTADSLIDFVVIEGGILRRDRKFSFTININIPSSEIRQINKSMKLNFGIEISFSIAPAPLITAQTGDSC
jgi:hypothetical protein